MGLPSECAPRPIPAMHFATWTTKRSCWKRKTLISYCFFTGRMGPPGWGYPQSVRCVPFLPRILRRGRQDVQVERKNVDVALVFYM